MGFTNVLLNPDAEGATLSLEADNAATVARSTAAEGTMPTQGSAFYTLTPTAATEASLRTLLTQRGSAAPGDQWWFTVKVRAKTSNTGTRNVSAGIRFYNAAPGASSGATLATTWGATVALAPGASATLLVGPISAPASTLSAGALVRREGNSGAATTDVIQLDELALVKGLPTAVQPPLGSGADSGWYWTGATDASPSYYPVTSPTLTYVTTRDPAPRVTIFYNDLPPSLASITLYRIVDNDVPQIVRGARGQATTAAFLVTDLEAPINRPITYRALMFDASGNQLGYTVDGTVTIPISDDPLGMYISDPLDASSAIHVVVAAEFAERVTRGRDANYAITGGGSDPVLLAGGSQGITGLTADFYTETATALAAFRALRRQTPLVVIRPVNPDIPIPGTLYCALVDPSEVRLDADYTQWIWTTRSVRSPEAAIVVPLRTYADYIAYFPTYAAAMAVFLTYVDSILNPPPAAS